MNLRKQIVTMVAALGLVAVGSAVSVSATPSPDARDRFAAASGTDGAVLRVASVTPRTTKQTQLAASSPSISPAPLENFHLPSGGGYLCFYGELCLEVWDPTVGKVEVFILYRCNRYWLSHFKDHRWGVNNQTTGTVARYYGQDGRQLFDSTAYDRRYVYWTPVWSVRNC
ncbi:hypothetical protein [Nocardioides speluncae]|uniref:hypothetical protein n=1 Tax=Nocardioides speluncae TaxID=2670337 RepID=UPI0012B17B77|nr:hypothetical protein [Nocardioides speluncae]